MTETITVTIPQGLREKIDSLRGDVSRSKFISRALQTAFYQAEVKK
jgi:metal-responsive CopG/Arc/MetJ family transcriptional regulator